MNKILLVEDDASISQLLQLHFREPEFDLVTCSMGQDAIFRVFSDGFDLMILDLRLPDISGIQVCEKIRKHYGSLPIIMLTSMAEESQIVNGLESGADDYITKPFSILELLARARSVLRRAKLKEKDSAVQENEMITCKNLMLNKSLRQALMDGKRVELTPKEFDLLFLLASHPGKPFSRQELLQKVWGFAFDSYEHTVTTHINRLRLKIESDLRSPQYILTAWGTGYRFAQ